MTIGRKTPFYHDNREYISAAKVQKKKRNTQTFGFFFFCKNRGLIRNDREIIQSKKLILFFSFFLLTIEFAVNLFEENGYKVGINEPYSNSEAPNCPFSYQSMMLEVNKRAYMEEDSLRLIERNDHKRNVRDLIENLLRQLTL